MPSTPDLALHGCFDRLDAPRPGFVSAVAFKLADPLLHDITKAAQGKHGLQFVSGSVPKLRVAGRSIDLRLSPEAFRTELYSAASPTAPAAVNLLGLVSHRGDLQELPDQDDAAGQDAALAALENSLAIHEQTKQANSTHLAHAVLPSYRSRHDAARKQKQDRRLIHSSQPLSPSLGGGSGGGGGPSHVDAGPTSAPAHDASVKQLMRTPLIHLLALEPASTDDICEKTRIPRSDLNGILLRIGTKGEDGKWKLSDRAYRDLDVWEFQYASQDDRQTAINNAIRAYDRQRIGKEEKIWQLLLPKAERNQGRTLSRLHLGVSKGLTPSYEASPSDLDGASQVKSATNTPRLGALPRPSSSKGNDVMKRLLSKDGGKKARALEADKERKRKEREDRQAAVASDREGKVVRRTATGKKPPGGYKSAEIVHSSAEESADERKPTESLTRVDSKTGAGGRKPAAKAKGTEVVAPTSGAKKTKTLAERSAAKQKAVAAAKAAASPVPKPANPAGKVTPRISNGHGLKVANAQPKAQYSPPKPGSSKPPVPSPLGAARPRVASDVSDRAAIGVQRVTQGATTPKGLGITLGGRPRQSTITSSDSTRSTGSDKKPGTDAAKPRKPPPGDVAADRKPVNGTKRKDPPSAPTPPVKHRKTESDSSQSQSSNISLLPSSTARTSPDDLVFERRGGGGGGGGSSSDSAASVLDSISYSQGIHLAERFREYYPRYERMYEALRVQQERGLAVAADEKEKLWSMHKRLEEMKRQIERAALREHED